MKSKILSGQYERRAELGLHYYNELCFKCDRIKKTIHPKPYNKNMTLHEKWHLFMKDVTSPVSFIDYGLYYLVAAALQRRVWVGPSHRQLFPNIYVILVAEPGIGKGLVIKPVTDILKYHKLKNPNEDYTPETKPKEPSDAVSVDPAMITAINHANYARASEDKPNMRRAITQEKLVIPVAADSTTFEALLQDIARSTRFINYRKFDPKQQKTTVEIYIHASLAFALEEISSLFAKNTEGVVNCLLKTYDCGDYTRKTKTQGEDHIRNCCLNFFGGTTPSFMQTIFNDKLISEGFSSRAWMIFEYENRSNSLMSPELTEEQEEARQDVIDHIGKLTKLYGQLRFTPEAWNYLENWWEFIHPVRKPNPSAKLIPYYARKNIHVQKMAMIKHFLKWVPEGDLVSQPEKWEPISLETTKEAMKELDDREQKMHYALNFDSRNPLTSIGKRVVQFIAASGGPQTYNKLLLEFEDAVRDNEMAEILEHLRSTHRIVNVQMGRNGKSVVGFDITNRRELQIKDAEVIDSEPSQTSPDLSESE